MQSSVGILGSSPIQGVINCFSEFFLRNYAVNNLRDGGWKLNLVQEISANMTFRDLSGLPASQHLVQRCNTSSGLVGIIPGRKSEVK